MKDFRELQVWHKAHKLALEVYKASAAFLKEETYALSSQIRRAAASIATILRRGAAEEARRSLSNFYKFRWGQRQKLNTKFYCLMN
jgi:four helix bundle protein